MFVLRHKSLGGDQLHCFGELLVPSAVLTGTCIHAGWALLAL